MAMASIPGEAARGAAAGQTSHKRARLTPIAGGALSGHSPANWTGVSDLVRAVGPRVAASDKRQALSVVAEIAGRAMGVRPARVFDALMAREARGSTGIGHGVAAPHARLAGLEQIGGIFVRLQNPVEFQAVDDQPVDLIFALLAPAETGPEHLRALARVARLLRRPEIREALRKARSSEEIRYLLSQEAKPSAA